MESDSSSLEIAVEQKTYLIHQQLIDDIAQYICLWLGVDTLELSIEMVHPETMQELNRSYRQKDRSTDVLSFPQQEWHQPITLDEPYILPLNQQQFSAAPQLLGDLVISLSDAELNAQNIGHTIDREICFLLVHGILHLCGHDHIEPEDEKIMTDQQQRIMRKLTDLKPQPIWTNCVRIK